eukprot:GHVU01036102.1.p1 GENE.GHVU01036102.1~~GHVU01036102.1.p1  ORF type:complete len:117 (+),score=20.09 GHVU01036102.1:240-590(+)
MQELGRADAAAPEHEGVRLEGRRGGEMNGRRENVRQASMVNVRSLLLLRLRRSCPAGDGDDDAAAAALYPHMHQFDLPPSVPLCVRRQAGARVRAQRIAGRRSLSMDGMPLGGAMF